MSKLVLHICSYHQLDDFCKRDKKKDQICRSYKHCSDFAVSRWQQHRRWNPCHQGDVIGRMYFVQEQLAYNQEAMLNIIILTLTPSRRLPLTKLSTLPRTMREWSSSFTVPEVVERPMSATPLLLSFMQMATLLFVSPLQPLLPFFFWWSYCSLLLPISHSYW